MPEIPLSVGSKLELLLSLPNFRILPRTLTHLSAYAYCRVYYNVHAPRVLHFSAFIILCNKSLNGDVARRDAPSKSWEQEGPLTI